MTPRPGLHPEAKRELREAADFYDLERPGLGTEFLDAVEATLLQLSEHPASSPVVFREMRRRVVTRFPYSVIYRVRDGAVYVSAVAHNSRRPFYWQDRV